MNERKPAKWLLIASILLLVAFFRLHRLRTIPWGLSQDETVNADTSLDLLDGPHVPFLAGGLGHEPLFHYLQAATLILFGDNVIGIRMPAVAAGMLLVAASYAMMRRLFGPMAAMTTAGGLAISWWPIVFSRIGIRAITFPLLLTLAVLSLWRGLASRRRIPVMLSGLFGGLAFYTYTSARVLPALALAWLAYAALFQRAKLRRHWRALLGAALIATVVVAPLALYLQAHPEFQERIQQLQGPLTALRQGDPLPVGRAALATLAMFSYNGEARWTYGIPGRPILDPLSGLLFYLGLVRCAVQVRRPACGLVGLWLLVTLTPSMITPDAPSSIRAIGALPVVYGMIGIGAAWLWTQATRRGRLMRACFLAALSLVGAIHLGWTYRDGFGAWASHHEVYWRYKAHFADIASFLDGQPTAMPMVVIELWIEPVDIDGLRRNLIHDERQPRWVQGGRSFIWPTGAEGSASAEGFTLAMPIFSTADDELWRLFAGDPPVVSTSAYRMPDGRPGVTFYTIETEPILSDFQARASRAPVTLPESAQTVPLPANFDAQIAFLGYQAPETTRPGDELRLITLWRVLRDSPEPLNIFVHLLDASGGLVAQHDGFDVWAASLRRGDVIAQLHIIPLESQIPPGRYRLQMGVYTRADQARLPVPIKESAIADRLWLDTVEVKPRQ